MYEEYILKFDLLEFDRQVVNTTRSFTDFGNAIRGVVKSMSEDVDKLNEEVSILSSSMATITSQFDYINSLMTKNMTDTVDLMNEMSKISVDFIKNLGDAASAIKNLSAGAGAGAGAQKKDPDANTRDIVKASDDSDDKAKAITAALNDAVAAISADLAAVVGETKKMLGEVADYYKEKVDKITSDLEKQGKGLLGKMSPISFGGGFIGGLIAMMALGYQEKERFERDSAEYRNIFLTSASSAFGKIAEDSIAKVTDFSIKAQFFYGIGKEETQNVLRTLIEGGNRWEDFTKKFSSDLGEVGGSIWQLSLGMDKLLGVSTGTAAKAMNEMVTKYADTLDGAAEKYLEIGMAARRSGMGISAFTNAVSAGSQAMIQYGIDMKDVAYVMETLQKHYKDMGLTEQYAGRLAAQAITGIASGIANLSMGELSEIAGMLGIQGDPLQRAMSFKEGFMKASDEREAISMQNITKAVMQFFVSRTGGERAATIYYMTQRGFEQPAATAMYDAYKKIEDSGELLKASDAELKDLKKAFARQGDTVSDLLKNQREVTLGLAEIGKGILRAISTLIGIVSVGITGVSGIISLIAGGEFSKAKLLAGEMSNKIDQLSSKFGQSWDEMKHGADMAATGLGKELKDIFGDFKDAMDFGKGTIGHWSVDQFKKEVSDVINDQQTAANLGFQTMRQGQELRAIISEALLGEDDKYAMSVKAQTEIAKAVIDEIQRSQWDSKKMTAAEMYKRAIVKVKATIDPKVWLAAQVVAEEKSHLRY